MSLKDLQNEHKEVKQLLTNLQYEIDLLQSKRKTLLDKCNDLETKIELHQAAQYSPECEEQKWATEDFPWKEKLYQILIDVFKITDFRMKQLEVLNATLSGDDVFVVMPTGGGKSLCYQLSSLLTSGITLVVSPLISLMEDQCLNIEQYGINAGFLCADTPKEKSSEILKSLGSPKIQFKLLFVTPEKIAKSKRFMAQLEKCYKNSNLGRIVIDEAHCASQWGNDFRPDYKVLGILKRQFPNSPVLALTATATSKVVADTKKMLNIPRALVFRTPLNRSNLFYEVRHKSNNFNHVMDDIAHTIQKNFTNQSGIIYCFSRADCMKVSESLNQKGTPSAFYHAYMTSSLKSKVHLQWRKGKIQVICATVAFGMGIDKSDVRFVIHHSMSKSLENYYQESGRAGRDGLPSLCLLYFGFHDIFRQSTMVLTEQTGLDNLASMTSYCHSMSRCRRELLSSHFGETPDSMHCNKGCDVCCGLLDVNEHDVTVLCRSLLDIVKKVEARGPDANRLTPLKLVEAAAGRGPEKTTNVDLKKTSSTHVQYIVTCMLMKGYLREDFHFTPYSTISYLVPGPNLPALELHRVHVYLSVDRKQPITNYNQLFSSLIGQHDASSSTSKRSSSVPVSTLGQKRIKKNSNRQTIVIDDSD